MTTPEVLVAEFTPTGSEPPPGMALKPGTVTSATGSDPGDTHVRIDGDTEATPIMSLIGAVNEGQRVMVLFWPPHGAYIIGLPGTPGTQWHGIAALGYTAGWSDLGGANQVGQFRLEGNTVKLRGIVQRTAGVATTIFTLPVGYRPGAAENFAVDATGNAHSAIAVNANGDVVWGQGAAASAAYVSLSGVWFDAYDYS